MKRAGRISILLIVLAALAMAYPKISYVVVAMIWLLLFANGIVSDMISGPEWINWALYLPTWLFYIGVAVAGFLWVRKAPA